MTPREPPGAGRGASREDADAADPGPAIPRRRFLRRAGGAAAGVLCAGGMASVAACAGVPYASATRIRGALRVPESAFGESDAVLVQDEGMRRPIFLRRVGAGEYTAVSTRCAHRGCQVQRQGDRLACPCHGSEYRLDGALLQGPADRALRRFRTRVRDGTVLIELEPRGGDR